MLSRSLWHHCNDWRDTGTSVYFSLSRQCFWYLTKISTTWLLRQKSNFSEMLVIHCGLLMSFKAIYNLVNIGSGNTLSLDNTKPLPEPMLTHRASVSSCDIHLRTISQKYIQNIYIIEVSLSINNLRLEAIHPGPKLIIGLLHNLMAPRCHKVLGYDFLPDIKLNSLFYGINNSKVAVALWMQPETHSAYAMITSLTTCVNDRYLRHG